MAVFLADSRASVPLILVAGLWFNGQGASISPDYQSWGRGLSRWRRLMQVGLGMRRARAGVGTDGFARPGGADLGAAGPDRQAGPAPIRPEVVIQERLPVPISKSVG